MRRLGAVASRCAAEGSPGLDLGFRSRLAIQSWAYAGVSRYRFVALGRPTWGVVSLAIRCHGGGPPG
jgi:hypothetical protein